VTPQKQHPVLLVYQHNHRRPVLARFPGGRVDDRGDDQRRGVPAWHADADPGGRKIAGPLAGH
jgi:hypothetical protein